MKNKQVQQVKKEIKLIPESVLKAKRIKMLVALFINLAVALLAVGGLVWSYMLNRSRIPETEKTWFWGWFTFQSTAFIGLASILSIVFFVIAFLKGHTEVPRFVNVIKVCAISATIVTFVITQVDFLKAVIPSKGQSGWTKLTGPNLIEHIIIPFLCVPCYLIAERTIKMKFVHNCYAMIHGAIYSGHYLAVGYKFIKPDGTFPVGPGNDGARYDRYGIFKMLGPKGAWVMILLMCGAMFLFAWLTWLINRKIHIYEEKAPLIISKKKRAKKAAQTVVKVK